MYTNIVVAVVENEEVRELIEVGCPNELSEDEQRAYAKLMAKVTGVREGVPGEAVVVDDPEVIKKDYYKNGKFIKRPEVRMTEYERIVAGYDPPPAGNIVDGGKIRPMNGEELVEAGLLSQEDYDRKLNTDKINKVISARNIRLEYLMAIDIKARAEVDPALEALRKNELSALNDMTSADDWMLNPKWPDKLVFEYLEGLQKPVKP